MVSRTVSIKKFSLGFTLIEILVVMGILGILAVSGYGSFVVSQQRARDTARRFDLGVIKQALEFYKSDYPGTGYPNANGETEGPLKGILVPDYISSSSYPKDPLNDYVYYYERVSLYNFNLCARLETPGTDDPPCENAALDCGANPCNYGITQP